MHFSYYDFILHVLLLFIHESLLLVSLGHVKIEAVLLTIKGKDHSTDRANGCQSHMENNRHGEQTYHSLRQGMGGVYLQKL